MNRVLFSTSPDTYHLAAAELRGAFGPVAIDRVGPDVGIADLGPIARVADVCRHRPIVFVQHLTQLAACLHEPSPAAIGAAATGVVDCERIAVQAWVSGTNQRDYGTAETVTAITAGLRDHGVTVSRAGAEYTLSVCLAPRYVLLGINRTADSIADWPGGRVRLGRRPEQVSRAEFKLEELLAAYPLRLSGHAVDYGAAPGGWTRILRTHGLTVTAVDPGNLDPRVAVDPGVTHLPTTAGEFLRANRRRLDIVVNDMRMEPLRSSQLMVRTASMLKPGGHAVITLKTGARQPLHTIDHCLRTLRGAYNVLLARQLHHNRHEVTVLLQRV